MIVRLARGGLGLVLGCGVGCLFAANSHQPETTAVPIAPRSAETSAKDAVLESARRAIASGHYQQAESSLRAYLVGSSRSAEGHKLLAYCLLRQNRPREALVEYTLAAAIEPPSAEDLKNVAQAYVLLGDYADATKWSSLSVQEDPSDPDAWYSLGRIDYTEQRFQAAVDCFHKVLALAPRSVKAENNLGLALEGLNRNDEAVEAYRQAVAWGDAQSSSNAGAAIKPGLEQPMLNLAILLIHRAGRADFDQALVLLQRAALIAPQDPRIHEQLGHVFLQQDALSAAQQEFEQAVALDPASAALHFLLGQTYRREGLIEKAKVEFDRASGIMGTHSSNQ